MKKRTMKNIAACTAVFLLFTSVSLAPASAAGASAAKPQRVGQMKVSGNYVSMEENAALLKASGSALRRSSSTLPARFDLRNDSGTARVTSVKSQGVDGTCWAFGALSSAESSLLTQMAGNGTRYSSVGQASSVVDFSERQLAWFAFHGANSSAVSAYAGGDTFTTSQNTYAAGGARFISVPTLARWYGCAAESDLPYQKNSSGSLMSVSGTAAQTISRAHLQNAVYLPEPVQSSGIDTAALTAIKQCIKSSGAISVGYHSPESDAENSRYYNSSTAAYYCSTDCASNHEVTIVGWDDNYARTNFNASNRPAKNGAWIVKNSWGTGSSNRVGSDGYFYLSYYDRSFSEPTSFQTESLSSYSSSNTSHIYSDVYQYDGVGLGGSWYTLDTPTYFANTFTARSDGTLQAVSAYAEASNSTITVDVYVNSSSSNPTSGTHTASLKCSKNYAGYYTIDLGSQAVGLKKGQTFSVVESSSFQYNGTHYVMLYETGRSLGGTSVKVSCSSGQSAMSFDNSNWTDMSAACNFNCDGSVAGNAAIKAFTTSSTTKAATPTGMESTKTLAVSCDYTFTLKTDAVPTCTSSNADVVTISIVKRDAATGLTTFDVYARGLPGSSAVVTVNADGKSQSCTVTLVKRPFHSDTTVNFTKQIGQSYCFTITPDNPSDVPSYSAGNGSILATAVTSAPTTANGQKTYYFKFTCIGTGCSGLYVTMNGTPYRVFYCNVVA